MDVKLFSTRCAICNTEGNATVLYPANFNEDTFNPAIFSARRLPDRLHYRMVRCNDCGLVRADPVADSSILEQLYTKSSFDYADEVTSLQLTYGHYLSKLADLGARKDALLEIGCGNGFFLEQALAQGYAEVRGIEPSQAAVDKADPSVRPFIVCDIMRPGIFEANRFDVICLFQVFDHISDPGALLAECYRILRPGGFLLCLNHNIEAISARLLKERSPIIDIEHTYLFSPDTISRIMLAHGFQIRDVGSARNSYTLHYLTRLVPMPIVIKHAALAWLRNSFVGRIRLRVPLGNLFIISCKPCED
jgi:SAM-dependent methyltransferase